MQTDLSESQQNEKPMPSDYQTITGSENKTSWSSDDLTSLSFDQSAAAVIGLNQI